MTTARLTYDAVIQVAAAVGGGHVLSESGIRATLGRPFAGDVDHEYYPSLWDKTATLVHGFATTQYFSDGNKRTAWIVAKTFLELNNIVLGQVLAVQAEAFVHAVAADRLPIPTIAEWYQSAWESRANDVYDDRLEYVVVAIDARLEHAQGTLSIESAGVAGAFAPDAGQVDILSLHVCGRVLWGAADDGSVHSVKAVVVDSAGEALEGGSSASFDEMPVVPSGHGYHRKGRMPGIFDMTVTPVIRKSGPLRIFVFIDDSLAAVRHFVLHDKPGANSF